MIFFNSQSKDDNMVICPYCKTENPENANYCLECGHKLETPDCPACNIGRLSEIIKKGTLGIGTIYTYECDHCGAIFEEHGSKYKLTHISNFNSPVWQKYRNKPLTFEEWTRIANGGVSDTEQRRLDKEEKERKQAEIKRQQKIAEEKRKQELKDQELLKEKDTHQFLDKLAKGNVNINNSIGAPVILKKNETTTLVMGNISFLEARSVRQTIGGYAGPTIRVAKGVSFRLGGVSARSVSHEELKKIDQGELVLTNKRLIFLGSKRTININLNKIIAIEPYKDGIGSQRENKQKTEYFTGTDKTTLTFSNEDRKTTIPVNGTVLKAAILGNISKLG